MLHVYSLVYNRGVILIAPKKMGALLYRQRVEGVSPLISRPLGYLGIYLANMLLGLPGFYGATFQYEPATRLQPT